MLSAFWCCGLPGCIFANAWSVCAGAFQREKELYDDPNQPLGRMLPQLHSIREGAEEGLRDACGSLLPPCMVMEKGEALDVWIRTSGERIDLFTGLQVWHALVAQRSCCSVRAFSPNALF
jgi:hypothetical protein